MKDVEIFVLDEADQMMDLGFIHALKRIDQLLPKQRQTLFFSATMPKAIAELGNRFLNNPVRVSVAPAATTAERVEQFVTFVEQREKQTLLTLKLQSEEIDRALVFTRTKHGADRVVRGLAGAGIQSAAIHGNKSQGQRTAALQAFRDGKIKILVATDIAARGIDVPGVSHVFNFELPNVPEQYVHRIGRTARAGREGVAMSFVAGDERGYMKDIERLTGVRAMTLGLPEGFRAAVAALPPPAADKKDRRQRAAVAVAVIPAADAPIMRARNSAATMAAPVATAKPASAPTPRKAAGHLLSARVTEAVKAARRRVRATTMRQAVIVVQPLIAPLPPAAKTAAIPAHLRAIMAPKRAVMVISGARSSGLGNRPTIVILNLFQDNAVPFVCYPETSSG